MTNNRKGTPDIMANLMSGTSPVANEQQNQQAIKQESNKTISISGNKAIKRVLENSASFTNTKCCMNSVGHTTGHFG